MKVANVRVEFVFCKMIDYYLIRLLKTSPRQSFRYIHSLRQIALSCPCRSRIK